MRVELAMSDSNRLAGLSLRQNLSWTTAGNLVYALCQWGVLTVIAKTGTPAMVGMFALGLAITAPVIQFANLQLRGVQATDARSDFAFGDYVVLRLITTLIALVATAGFVLGIDRSRETTAVILLIALAKAVDALSDVVYGYFQQIERMDVIARAQVANGLLSFALVAVGLVVFDDIVAGVAGYLVGFIVPLVAYTIPAARRSIQAGEPLGSMVHWNTTRIWHLAWTALPLGVVMLLISLNANIPRYVVEHEQGEHGLGVFAALVYIVVAAGMVVTAVGQAVSPRLARQYAAGANDGFRKVLTRAVQISLALGVIGALVALAVGRPVIALLYASEYADDPVALAILALAGGVTFAASFAGFAMTAARRFRPQVPVFLVVVLSTTVASLVLVPNYGLRGAMCALLLGSAVQLGASLWVVREALAWEGSA
jgi:O-antigen/teichoic acid export membrane protein